MAPVFTPHWKKDSGPLSPTNWIFYAVSKIHGHYYPLSVWCEENPSKLHAGRQDDAWRVRGLVASCLRTVSIFSNPNNRRAIQNDLNMAKSFYQNPEHLLQPTLQLPNPSKGHPTSTQDDRVVRSHQGSLQESKDDFEHCLFPFISTCLLLGASSYLPSYRYNFFPRWQAMPLSLAYFEQQLAYGMVVIDITDQTRVGYGIVAFAAYDMLWVEKDPELDWDAWGPDFGPQKMELEDDRQRVVLSGSDYITKFGYEKAENMERFYMTCPELKLLDKVPVVDACVFNVIWPITPRKLHSVSPIDTPSTTEVDGSIVHLVDAALRRDAVHVSQFSSIRNLDHFQEMEEVSGSVFLSAMYQAAICKTLWFPEHHQPAYNRFPVRNVFYRTQLNSYDPATYDFAHFRMDHMLLGPESFVARFLSWLRHPDLHMAGMACGPDTLADLSRLDVRPLPIGGCAQPRRFLEAADIIITRGWTVLVSKRTLTNYLVAEDNMCGSRENLPEDCQWMEYAFVRSGCDVHGKPQVVGVREFLEITAPEVDLDLVQRELVQTASWIETWEEQAPFLPSMEALRLLDVDDEQDHLFREFLRSTVVADTRDHPETDY